MISGVDMKGVDIAIEAMAHLRDCQLLIIGQDLRGAGIPTSSPEKRNITYLGRVERRLVPAYLRAADVLVIPHRPEGFFAPLKLFEYMASGRPIVASDVPQLQEFLTDGQNALLFEAERPEAMVQAVRRVLESPLLAERLARRARQDVERYTWQRRGEIIRDFLRGGVYLAALSSRLDRAEVRASPSPRTCAPAASSRLNSRPWCRRISSHLLGLAPQRARVGHGGGGRVVAREAADVGHRAVGQRQIAVGGVEVEVLRRGASRR
jgi:hypothetical protein